MNIMMAVMSRVPMVSVLPPSSSQEAGPAGGGGTQQHHHARCSSCPSSTWAGEHLAWWCCCVPPPPAGPASWELLGGSTDTMGTLDITAIMMFIRLWTTLTMTTSL